MVLFVTERLLQIASKSAKCRGKCVLIVGVKMSSRIVRRAARERGIPLWACWSSSRRREHGMVVQGLWPEITGELALVLRSRKR